VKQIGILLCIYFFGILPLLSQNINIPDQCFTDALIENGVDTNEDGLISYAEAEAVEWLDIWSECIRDIRGIEAFLNLTHFSCSSDKLRKVDLSGNSRLSHLVIAGQFDTLDLSHNPLLDSLWCYGSSISNLDVSKCENLIALNTRWNQLTHLDLSQNKNLEYLNCSGNQLTELDLSGCPKLNGLDCSENQIRNLELSGLRTIERLECQQNKMSNLDLSSIDSLLFLNCRDNLLQSLNLKHNPYLEFLICSYNLIRNLDVSMNLHLRMLHCGQNPMTALNISNNLALDTAGNGFGIVDLSLHDMPSLVQVCVWALPFPPEGLSMDTIGSPNITFTTECTVGSALNQSGSLTIYPNPTEGPVTIRMGARNNYLVIITALNGQLMQERAFSGDEVGLDISSFPRGMYLISIRSPHRIFTEKIIKR